MHVYCMKAINQLVISRDGTQWSTSYLTINLVYVCIKQYVVYTYVFLCNAYILFLY